MDVLMPQLGETVAEGKITKWFKSAGDPVKPGDNLFEIETDKVSMEVPSTTSGVLAEIRVGTGEVALVGAIVAVIAGEGGAATASASAPQDASARQDKAPSDAARAPTQARTQNSDLQRLDHPVAEPGPRGNERSRGQAHTTPIALDPFFEVRTPERNFGPARLAGGTAVTPLARRLASEAGIDLDRIAASGPHGRSVARDGAALVAARPAPAAAPTAHGPSAKEVLALYRDVPFEEIPLDGMRRTIATRLTQATQTIPHFYLTADVEIGRLIALREEVNAAAPKDKNGGPAFKLSVNDFIIKAWALALQRIPAANAVWAQDRILRFKHSDIGVAVALDGGLITPIVREAEMKSLGAISAQMRSLAERARERKLKPNEYQGGSSAISNLGMYGVREFAAIINPPHATILAVGAARRQAVERADGSVGFASVMSVTLSCDHRVVDGALGAQLLAAFRTCVEQPVTMLI
jgi:pyruvate dehydrogenase E2 component (dihydrolipoamide acetyltransferase)